MQGMLGETYFLSYAHSQVADGGAQHKEEL